MEKIMLNGYKNQPFPVYQFEVVNPKAILILVHGVAECAQRYEYVANYLNTHQINVYVADHIAHGPDTKQESLGHWEKGDFDGCLKNVHTIYETMKKKYSNLPFYLLGHSMGSFMVQKYEYLYPKNFEGTILTGCAKADFVFHFGRVFSSFVALFNKKDKRIPLIDNIAFGNFNKKFKPNKTNCDWLCKDEKICQWYQDTPYTGFVGTAGFYKEFYKNVSKIPNKKFKHLLNEDYPLLLLGGKEDMVSNRGKRFLKLVKYYQKQTKDLTYHLLDNIRHELFNEPEKDEILKILSDWLNEKIKRYE